MALVKLTASGSRRVAARAEGCGRAAVSVDWIRVLSVGRGAMGRIAVAVALALILLPFMLAAFLVDLTRKQAIIFLACTVLAGGAVAFYNTEAFTHLWWRWTAPPAPADQDRFVATVEDIRQSADEHLDARRLEALRARLCATPDEVAGWTGVVANAFNSPSGRNRVVVVNIAPHIVLRTALADDWTETLIGEEAAVYPAAVELSSGDPVVLSGGFVADAGSCRGSQGTGDALREPNFIFRFSGIQRYGAE